MFGDDDPDIAPFFAKFLRESTTTYPQATRRDGRVRPTRYGVDAAPITSGLALGLAGAAAILEDRAGPAVRVRSRRAETFHRMLEDMANGILENGHHVPVIPSREVTPRSEVSEPPLDPAELAEPLPHSYPPLVPGAPEEVDLLEEASDESSDESAPDAVDVTPVAAVRSPAPVKYAPSDFGASKPLPSTPTNHMRLSVALKTGKRIFDNKDFSLDSSVEDIFALIETKIGKPISSLITRHGLELERSELPIKWSGLQEGDLITAVHHTHPPVDKRLSPASLQKRAETELSKKFQVSNLSMGAFGDIIATQAGIPEPPQPPQPARGSVSKAYPGGQTTSGLLQQAYPGMETPAPAIEPDDAEAGSFALPDHWGGLGLTAAIQSAGMNVNLVPPVPPGSEAAEMHQNLNKVPVLSPPTCMPDEFEDLPADEFSTDNAWQLPQHGASLVSPVKPRQAQARKAAESPPPLAAAALASATPTSSRLSENLSFAPTPSRKLQGPSGQQRADAEELKRKMDEKQKQNDAIWANIASTLEPAQQEITKRTFLSNTTSAGSLGGRKIPPMARTRR